uniref:Related to multidrug resistance protein n=1 Tax=Melanopsichium pennsylvanicum 4 TaxID=1398559 RepID=A0A077QSS1_9BASI|nr:related to multidrug resistance protein [Melanopsichium pennsylvanicum 4]
MARDNAHPPSSLVATGSAPRSSSTSQSTSPSEQGQHRPKSHPLSFTENSTAVGTPMQASEAPTRVNSFDVSSAERMLQRLHARVGKGDSTAIAEDEHLAKLHQSPPQKLHLHHPHLQKWKDFEKADKQHLPLDRIALEEGHAVSDSYKAEKKQQHRPVDEEVPSVLLLEDEDPTQWTNRRKWITTALVSCLYFNATITSSVGTGATAQYIHQFFISQEISALVLSIYMIGFCVGPPLWAPLSELYGRVIVNYISVPGYFFFNIGCALAPNIQTLLVCRLLVGLFAAAPQSNSGGTISDIWLPQVRLWPMFTYSLSAFMGPTLGPLVGGFIAGNDVGSERWR